MWTPRRANVPPDVLIHTDGGSRGNPGVAGYGVVVRSGDGKRFVCSFGDYLGDTSTNMTAEWTAVVRALEWATAHGCTSIQLFCDCDTVVKQYKGEYATMKEHLIPLNRRAHELARGLDFFIAHVYREDNEDADAVANVAMDCKGKVQVLGTQ